MSGRRVRHPSIRPGAPRWSQTAVDVDDGEGVYSPTSLDPVARSASAILGGPAGRRLAGAAGFWRASTVLVVLACLTMALGVVQKQHCRAVGWSSPDQFWHACYSDIPVIYASSDLGTAGGPSLTQALDPGSSGGLNQAPLTGLVMWFSARLLPASGVHAMRNYFDLSALLLAVVLAIGVAAAAFTLGRRGWDAAHLAISPVLITAGLISYQVLAITLLAIALFALSRNRAILGGVVLGLAVSAAAQVAVVGIVVAVLALWRRPGPQASFGPVDATTDPTIDPDPANHPDPAIDPAIDQTIDQTIDQASRSRGAPEGDPRPLAAAAFAGTALISWMVVRILLLPGWGGGAKEAWNAWRQGSPGYGSLWTVPRLLHASEPVPASSTAGRGIQALVGWLFDAGALSGGASTVLIVIALVVGGGVLLRITLLRVPPLAPIRTSARIPVQDTPEPLPGPEPSVRLDEFVTRRVAPAALAALALVLVTAKALPPQASLLLLPLIALSGLRWRDHLIWAGTELVYFVGVWLYIAADTTANRGLPAQFYLLMIVARLAGIAWIGVQGVLVYRASQAYRESGPVFGELGPVTGGLRIQEISSPATDPGTLADDRDAGAPRHTG